MLLKDFFKNNIETTLSNEAFQALPLLEKKVQIAKDVIAQLTGKAIYAMSGTWAPQPSRRDADSGKDMQEVLGECPTGNCDVCAIGAIFTTVVMRTNNCKSNKFTSSYAFYESVVEYLSPYFTEKEVESIESAFEGPDGWVLGGCDKCKYICKEDNECGCERAVFCDCARCYSPCYAHQESYGHWYKNRRSTANDRMKTIMQNIIDNGGYFNP